MPRWAVSSSRGSSPRETPPPCESICPPAAKYGRLALALTLDPDALCPVCSRSDPRLRYRLSKFRVYECTGCALIYLWPRLTDGAVRELFHRLYTEGEGSLPELKSYYDFTYDDSPARIRWFSSTSAGWTRSRANASDGANPGHRMRHGSVPGRREDGAAGSLTEIDACTEAITHTRAIISAWTCGKARVLRLRGEPDQTFDAITMWDIIEHAARSR